MRAAWFEVLLLLILGSAALLDADPLQNYNIYTHTPRIRIVETERQIDSLWESDEQYRVVSFFSNDFRMKGSSFFIAEQSSNRMVASRGSLTRMYTNMSQVARIDLSFSRRGLNLVNLEFLHPIELPLWAESIEFWGHGHGIRHGYRVIYRDEAGQHYTLDFGTTRHYGWRRFSATIPLRADTSRPFSERYKKFFITALVVLDDNASRQKPTLLHLANLAVSRIRRTLFNQKEFWQFRRLVTFDAFTLPALATRFHGYTNVSVLTTRVTPSGLSKAAHPLFSGLEIRADWVPEGSHRAIVRFQTPLKANVCRKIILTVKGTRRHERLWVLVQNLTGSYYLLRAGQVDFDGWQKLSLDIPYWIIQQTGNITESRGLLIREILVEPAEPMMARDGLSLMFGSISVVEDMGDFQAPALEILEKW
ncbi:MAG TPA: hypothetical protein PLM00_01330 [Spirochaetota bacterium]|nr:hypothetical protein [Spirochaetota bacterium]HPH01558.1 hypothetical protein [Spirochaetota bacterium]HPN81999.1 hypothetical protein [Spirochaetota bacterium]